MSFLRNFVKYVKDRLNQPSTIEVISKNFGAVLFIWAGVAVNITVSFLMTGVLNFTAPLIIGIGATLEFIGVLLRCMFGKKAKEVVV